MSEAELDYLVAHVKIVHIPKGELIFREGDPSLSMFFLVEGIIKITSTTKDNREVIFNIIHPKAILGELSLALEEKRSNSSYVMSQSATLLEIDRQIIFDLVEKNVKLARCIINFLGSKLKYVEARMESLAVNDARERVLEFLKANAQTFGKPVGFETLLKHEFTQQDIANFTGTSRQTVTTILNELKKSNKIFFRRKSILIRDLEALN